VIVFTGGNIDLFKCEIPSNVALRVGKKATVTVSTSSESKQTNSSEQSIEPKPTAQSN
jgi:hypothetical protein